MNYSVPVAIYDAVMPGLVPGIHAFLIRRQGVGGRDKPGHDGGKSDAKVTP